MKKFLKFLFYWCLPGLLLLPIGGCFSCLSHFMGSKPSTGEAIVAGALDVATMPVQIVVLGPIIAKEYIDANTGERGRKKREAEQRRKEIDGYKEMLTSDFSQVYRNDEFFSITNTPARDALYEWLRAYGNHFSPKEEIDHFVERLIAVPEVAAALMPVFHQRNLSVELKKKLCRTLIEFSRAKDSDTRSRIIHRADEIFSDEELRGLISESQDETDNAMNDLLRKREERRERERKEAEARAARQQAEEAELRKRREEENRRRQQRFRELRGAAKNIDAGIDEFVKTLPLRRESVVSNFWLQRLRNVSKPIPPENVRKFAEVLTEPGEPMSRCCQELFLRPELTEADLRNLYPRVLEKLAEEGEWQTEGWWYAGALIKNPNFPSDLALASYGEPLLTELRIVYVFHHVHSRNFEKGELQKFEQECDGLKRECRSGKISLEECNAKRFKLTKKYLPEECPEDWIKSIP